MNKMTEFIEACKSDAKFTSKMHLSSTPERGCTIYQDKEYNFTISNGTMAAQNVVESFQKEFGAFYEALNSKGLKIETLKITR